LKFGVILSNLGLRTCRNAQKSFKTAFGGHFKLFKSTLSNFLQFFNFLPILVGSLYLIRDFLKVWGTTFLAEKVGAPFILT
jgi:hypothetical protein